MYFLELFKLRELLDVHMKSYKERYYYISIIFKLDFFDEFWKK